MAHLLTPDVIAFAVFILIGLVGWMYVENKASHAKIFDMLIDLIKGKDK